MESSCITRRSKTLRWLDKEKNITKKLYSAATIHTVVFMYLFFSCVVFMLLCKENRSKGVTNSSFVTRIKLLKALICSLIFLHAIKLGVKRRLVSRD